MKLISCHKGQIFTSSSSSLQCGLSGTEGSNVFKTGLHPLDTLLPGNAFARGAVHEILYPPRQSTPRFFALLLAKSAGGNIVWCDPEQTLYPPAVASAGIPLHRLFLLRPKNRVDLSWAIAECMRCKGVGVTVAQISGKFSRIETRRLQLAAESGGGVALLIRMLDRNASVYAAASRWLITPTPGERMVQKWKVQLIHAHGGRVGETVILERYRENNQTNIVHPAEKLADRSAVATEVA